MSPVKPTVCHSVSQNPRLLFGLVVCTTLVPGVVCANATVGVVPPVSAFVPITIVGCGRLASDPANVTTIAVPGHGPPLTVTFPVPMFGSASSAVCSAAEAAL
jgi:hypothetical protein